MSTSALLVLRTRDGVEEACHSGSALVVDRAGAVVFSAGNAERMLLPRSSIKLVQALPFIQALSFVQALPVSCSGTAGQSSCAEIALAASSHCADPLHLRALSSWAERLGVGESDLVCGPDFPLGRKHLPPDVIMGAFHNNNAGKHLAVIATCRSLQEDIADYCAVDHPAQQRILETIARVCAVDVPRETLLDNCGMRTFAIPLYNLALGMMRLGTGNGLSPPDVLAAKRLSDAIIREPDYFAGARRLPSRLVCMTQGRIVAKGGSEGVFSAFDRDKGFGFALKMDDGSAEAASAVLVALLTRVGSLSSEEGVQLQGALNPWQHPFAHERSPAVTFPFLD